MRGTRLAFRACDIEQFTGAEIGTDARHLNWLMEDEKGHLSIENGGQL